VILVALTVLASAACDTLHPEELDCEEAVAYYQKCCPSGPSPSIQCIDSVGFQVTSTRPPDISEFQSACLRAMSCDELVAGGYCAAASAFQPSNANLTLFPPPLGCQTPPVCNGIPLPATGVSGSVTASFDGTPLGDLTQNGSLQASNGTTASATLTFGNANYQLAIQCQDILPTESMIGGSRSFAQMCMSTTLALSGSAVEEPLTFDLTSVPGNVRTSSTLDSNGNGTVTVVVDIPPVDLPAVPAGSTLQLSISGLTVKQTFAAESCPSGGGIGGCAVATSGDAPTTSPMLLGAVALALLLRRRRSLALAPAVLLWLWPRAAVAQELPSQTVAPPPIAPEPTAAPAADAPTSYRLAAVGTFFNVFDLHAWGAGAEASLVVGRHEVSEVHAALRFIQELTFAGVYMEDVSAGATIEFLLGSSGLRAGVGGGAMYLLVRRATTASFIAVPGLDACTRFGYDAGLANRPFVMAELEIRAPLGALAWGPTLQAGWRF
jgi:MYXO-CTERM domain-containing protein